MIQNLIDYFSMVAFMGEMLQNIIGFSIVFTVYQFVNKWRWITVSLSCGSFAVRKKYFTVQNITNIVSCNFYNGEQVPASVRKEILEITCPKIKELKK